MFIAVGRKILPRPVVNINIGGNKIACFQFTFSAAPVLLRFCCFERPRNGEKLKFIIVFAVPKGLRFCGVRRAVKSDMSADSSAMPAVFPFSERADISASCLLRALLRFAREETCSPLSVP